MKTDEELLMEYSSVVTGTSGFWLVTIPKNNLRLMLDEYASTLNRELKEENERMREMLKGVIQVLRDERAGGQPIERSLMLCMKISQAKALLSESSKEDKPLE
jgi:hypothetical protein